MRNFWEIIEIIEIMWVQVHNETRKSFFRLLRLLMISYPVMIFVTHTSTKPDQMVISIIEQPPC